MMLKSLHINDAYTFLAEQLPESLQNTKPNIDKWLEYFGEQNLKYIEKTVDLDVFEFYDENKQLLDVEKLNLGYYYENAKLFARKITIRWFERVVLNDAFLYQESELRCLCKIFKERKSDTEYFKNFQSYVTKNHPSAYDLYLLPKYIEDFSDVEIELMKEYKLSQYKKILDTFKTYPPLLEYRNKFKTHNAEFLYINQYILNKNKIVPNNKKLLEFLDKYNIPYLDVENIDIVVKYYNKEINRELLVEKICDIDEYAELLKAILEEYAVINPIPTITTMKTNMSIEEVIEKLKIYMNINGNNICKVTMIIDVKDGVQRSYTIKNKFMSTIIKEVLEEVSAFIEYYSSNNDGAWKSDLVREYVGEVKPETIIKDLIIYDYPMKINSGKFDIELKIVNNEPYYVIFPNTLKLCLLEACLYNNPNRKSLYEHFSRSGYNNTDDAADYIEQVYNISEYLKKEITLSDETVFNYDPLKINIYLKSNHAGRLLKLDELDVSAYELNKDYEPLEYPCIDDVNIIVYDGEWNWESIGDNIYENNDPIIVSCVIRENKKLNIKRQEHIFKNMKELFTVIDTFKNKPFNTYMFSHNGAKVEHQFVIKELIRNSEKTATFNMEFKNISGTAIKSFNIGNVKFRDTLLFLDSDLETACHFSEKYKKFTEHPDLINYLKQFPKEEEKQRKNEYYLTKKWDVTNLDDRKYALYDSLCLMDVVLGINKELTKLLLIEDNKFLLITASISGIVKDHLYKLFNVGVNTEYTAGIFYLGYLGGRNEMFKKGLFSKVTMGDINSAYPHVMRKPLPGKVLYENKEISDGFWQGVMTIRYKQEYSPPFHLLGIKRKGKLIFPRISNWTTLYIHSFEYEYLKDNIEILKIYKIVHFAENNNISKFIEDTYQSRLDIGKNTAAGKARKIFLNRGYGAMATKKDRPCKNLYHKDNKTIRNKMGNLDAYYEQDYNDCPDLKWISYHKFTLPTNMIHVASHITAAVRFELYLEILRLHNLGHTILYCDTDSIYFINNTNEIFVDSKELGKWEYEESTNMEIFGCKDYSYVDADNIKQVKQKGKPKNSYTWIRDLSKLNITLKELKKEFTRDYTKGTVLEDGSVIAPEI